MDIGTFPFVHVKIIGDSTNSTPCQYFKTPVFGFLRDVLFEPILSLVRDHLLPRSFFLRVPISGMHHATYSREVGLCKPVLVVVVTVGYCLGVVFEMNVFGEFFKFVATHDISNCRKMKFSGPVHLIACSPDPSSPVSQHIVQAQYHWCEN